jgi:hypothetical protein
MPELPEAPTRHEAPSLSWERLPDSPDVVMVYGFWGQNIGNAFFNVGGHWLLSQVFGRENVGRVQDQPAYRTFYDQAKGNPATALELIGSLDCKVLVLQGPMLTETFPAIWERTFERLIANGTKIVLLGAALFRHTAEEVAVVRAFFRRCPIAVMTTRDAESYAALCDEVGAAHDGIDSAFFLPDAIPVPRLTLDPYYCFTFDRFPEPTVVVGPTGSRRRGRTAFEWNGRDWSLDTPRLVSNLAARGKAMAYLGHLADRRSFPTELDGHLIVRPEHRTNPHITWKIYRHAHAVASDEPFTYALVYARTQLTLSDRVHACVATLAFGNPAMLFTPSPRARLFDRVGLGAIREHPVSIDLELLRAEKQAVYAFLAGQRDDLVR